MCGIAGLWNFDGAPASQALVAAMNGLQSHRGPDGEGLATWGGVAFGHRRLAILDPSEAGLQPMSYGDGRYRITYNGEIYNFLELRAELSALGHRFRSETDTEVVLAAYAQWGADCQFRFNGMWGFAIWDAFAQTLFLSRDRFGVKPLYYRLTDNAIVFASELKAFLALSPEVLQIDAGILALDLTDRFSTESLAPTMLTGVVRLLPGHCLTIRQDGRRELRRWWKTLDWIEQRTYNENEAAERLREIFLDACALRMRSDVPIATALSGGLDSTCVHGAIAYLAKRSAQVDRSAPEWRFAVHADFPNTRQNERSYAEAAIAKEGTTGIFVTISPDDVLAHMDEAIYSGESVTSNTTALWLTYKAASQRGIKVSLDGHGADELYCGYHHYLTKAVSAVRNDFMRRQFEEVLTGMTVPGDGAGGDALGLDRTYYLRTEPSLPDLTVMIADIKETALFDPITREMFLDFHYRTMPPILKNFDRVSMAHGVEIRAPFLDWRLVVDAFALPLESKIANGYTKHLMRTALGDLMPDEVRLRKTKIGFETPISEWLDTGVIGFMYDTIHSDSFRQSEIWQGDVIRAIADDHRTRGDGRIIPWLWQFVQAHRLMDLFQKHARTAASGQDVKVR